MTFTLTFPTSGQLPATADIASWVTGQGEPFEYEGTETICLRALPLRVHVAQAGLQASVNVEVNTPLTRLVRVVFELSMHVGADVHLVGSGRVRRQALWLRMADEQDRLRIASALDRAAAHHVRDDVLTDLWAMLSSVGGGRDLRWDFQRSVIVECKELPVQKQDDDASFDSDTITGTTITLPIQDPLHVLAWRWLAEAYPSLATRG